jgi:hypothetical protein
MVFKFVRRSIYADSEKVETNGSAYRFRVIAQFGAFGICVDHTTTRNQCAKSTLILDRMQKSGSRLMLTKVHVVVPTETVNGQGECSNGNPFSLGSGSVSL